MSTDVQGNDCDGLHAEVTPERADPSVVGDGRAPVLPRIARRKCNSSTPDVSSYAVFVPGWR